MQVLKLHVTAVSLDHSRTSVRLLRHIEAARIGCPDQRSHAARKRGKAEPKISAVLLNLGPLLNGLRLPPGML